MLAQRSCNKIDTRVPSAPAFINFRQNIDGAVVSVAYHTFLEASRSTVARLTELSAIRMSWGTASDTARHRRQDWQGHKQIDE